LFQVSGELCLLADVIQRQYLLIRICTGDRADGQDHVELSVTVSVSLPVSLGVVPQAASVSIIAVASSMVKSFFMRISSFGLLP
jgi:hypothetical protein